MRVPRISPVLVLPLPVGPQSAARRRRLSRVASTAWKLYALAAIVILPPPPGGP